MSLTKTLNKTTTKSKASANKVAVANKLSLDKKEKTEDKDTALLENKKGADTPVKNAASLWSGSVQTNLKIGSPGGKHEKEADAVAEKVMNDVGPGQATMSSAHTISKKEKEEFQPKPIQKKEEEDIQPKFIQRKEEEEVQAKLIQQQEEEEVQPKFIQKKEEEEVQAKLIQRQEEEKEPIQAKFIQRQVEEKEEPAQAKLIQREGEEKEEPVQAKLIQKQEEEKEQPVQKKANGESSNASAGVESGINSTKGGGQSLDSGTQEQMGASIGADFSNVNVHTDSTAVQMNQDLNSKAFTHGSDIYFNQGNYDTKSTAGKGLLAHELTHTVQQGAAVRTKKESLSKTNQPIIQRKGWIQKKIEQGLNWAAERLVPGYTLLNVILGKNIITDAPVARSGVNLIEGFMDMTPVIGKILFKELKETNSLAAAGIWVEKKVAKFGIDFNDIARRLKLMWDEMSIWNGVKGNIKIFKKYFGRDVRRIFAFASVVESKVKELRFEGVLRLVGAHDLIRKLKKNKTALKRTIDNPKSILKFFMIALKQGFNNFKTNFGAFFKNALFGWLFGKAAEMGVEIPKKFDIPSLFHFIAQLIGGTYQQIRMIVVKKLGGAGEKIVGYMEKGAGFVKDLVTKGPIAMWEKVKDSLGNLKTMIFSQVTKLVITEIVKQAVLKLVSMLNPAGAIIQLVMGIYRVIKFFIDWWDTIKGLANAILSSIVNVAMGDTKGATASIVKIMAKGMTLVIAFLANVFGLGGIVGKVKKLIKKISKPVQKAIGKVVGWIVRKGKKLFSKLFGKGKKGSAKKIKEENKNAKPGKITAKDKKKHKKIIDNIDASLKKDKIKDNESFTDFHKRKQKEGKALEDKYQPQLKKGINLDVKYKSVQEDEKDGDMDIKIKIAPNQTVENVTLRTGESKELASGMNQKKLGIIKSDEISDRNGTLVGSSTKLGANLGESTLPKIGTRSNYAAHHMIATSSANRSIPFMHAAKESGYNINRASNGIWLPRTIKIAKKVDLPTHSGGHIRKYFNTVDNILQLEKNNALKAKSSKKPWSEKQLIDRVSNIENNLEIRLRDMKDSLKLQHEDPLKPKDPNPKKDTF